MKIGVVQFPGSNCDQDCLRALTDGLEFEADYLWHKETSVAGYEGIVLPGGFSYGDYLRCGAIARFSPIMRAVVEAAQDGMPILGICNGFQILCESGLLPGALIRNQSLLFVCQPVWIRVETCDAPCTRMLKRGQKLRLPVAHGEGAYIADERTLHDLDSNDQVIFRYVDSSGEPTPAGNPNGSLRNIAGLCNRERNVVGMMPHPDRAWDARLGSEDGLLLLRSMFRSVLAATA
ncbi:MAG TPA: phosphoribosylformylglycinamidine synthase subunit PurQ [Chthoniobacterales bacterium]|jgi:phosphoribosylformylglycinamidine synthase|nr:phosphoribosylformylglycinamidine synthase subunit PurQ [Chthoniobacterales bacterium]